MTYELSQISGVLKEALIIAWTLDHFKGAKVTFELSCFDGSTATVTETMDHLSDDTDNSGSSIQRTPSQRSIVDQLGDIKTNTWF
ncbi:MULTISPECIES: hypothetical protein [Marinobacter]|jgi:hypothetical protein|uniref:Uncharacterized protein n=1 Tax=Marinobacter daepoensis TaxID=262077 RepID=A0ABS3BAN9_9GAMM|nr:hypothetical protein [Marinobacter daepoensis]MBN7768827.1 hypothetical protein [Marinobacter daepoensis]MBY6079564.1 hypothetical protein [Marinobacter daepoensis]|tara:strand:- start:14810 stop:15064 length:255 start_codon:yes stop_codon:yes gene_type:complete